MSIPTITTPATNLDARAAWSILTEPADHIAGALTDALGHADALTAVTSGALADALPNHDPRDVADAQKRWNGRLPSLTRLVDDALTRAAQHGITLIDPSQIPGLADLGTGKPHALWIKGDTTALNNPLTTKIALIGARASTGYGDNITAQLAHDIAAAGLTTISGGAYGIDGAAHRAALATGGATIAFTAGGADRAYPAGHSDLFGRIATADRSALISEVAPGATPTKWRFLTRARLIAAASAATVVVEAGSRSGSLNTASHANALNRGLGAVPGPITSAASSGCHRLLRDYQATAITSGAEAIELLNT